MLAAIQLYVADMDTATPINVMAVYTRATSFQHSQDQLATEGKWIILGIALLGVGSSWRNQGTRE